mgnify:CR=1 FL=1
MSVSCLHDLFLLLNDFSILFIEWVGLGFFTASDEPVGSNASFILFWAITFSFVNDNSLTEWIFLLIISLWISYGISLLKFMIYRCFWFSTSLLDMLFRFDYLKESIFEPLSSFGWNLIWVPDIFVTLLLDWSRDEIAYALCVL